MPARLRARLAQQQGFTLVELVTVLAILSTVLTGIMVMFVAGTHAEVDMNERFQAQQEARVALATLRREVRTACWYDATTTPTTTDPANPLPLVGKVTLGYCKDTTSVLKVTSQITWCADLIGTQRYALYRQSDTSCSSASGVKKGDRLVSGAVFGVVRGPDDARPKLTVSLDVDANPATSGRTYLLADQIMFRNFRDGTAP